ncbi:winged helix-turn-helix transcriptional regulator [Lentzea sp. NPDC055074]
MNAIEECGEVHAFLSIVGDKWSLRVLGTLQRSTMRFTEIQRALAGISHRMLTLTLRQLERDGLVSRTVHATVPPRVDYTLTDLGSTFLEPVLELGRWAMANQSRMRASRRAFDASSAKDGAAHP